MGEIDNHEYHLHNFFFVIRSPKTQNLIIYTLCEIKSHKDLALAIMKKIRRTGQPGYQPSTSIHLPSDD